jgi:hypothetical protein
MADIPQVLATYDALVGVALGAGLTYGLGALNRRHQEKREEANRLYEARFQAYAKLSEAALARSVVDPQTSPNVEERFSQAMAAATSAMGSIALVGSEEVLIAANDLIVKVGEETARTDPDLYRLRDALIAFREAARKDLGHPQIEH